MGKMSDISIQLEEFRDLLYSRGLGDPMVQSELKTISLLGFRDEVECIIHEFETAVFNGDLENF